VVLNALSSFAVARDKMNVVVRLGGGPVLRFDARARDEMSGCRCENGYYVGDRLITGDVPDAKAPKRIANVRSLSPFEPGAYGSLVNSKLWENPAAVAVVMQRLPGLGPPGTLHS
jgi:hypothetical protein